jgi:hypothetical protein
METAKKGGSERKGIESQTKRLKVNGHQMRLFQCCLMDLIPHSQSGLH